MTVGDQTIAQDVTTEHRGHVLLIGLNRPRKHNAFSVRMHRLLAEAYERYEQDLEARCAVLFAHGDHFTAGLDLAEVGPAVQSGADLFPPGIVDPLDLFDPRRTKPVIGAVQGWCLTIGVELLLACDMGIAARDTRFAQMEVKRGIMPFGGATSRLPRRAGWGNAMRWMLTGGEFDAAEALRLGLVQEVVEPGRQLARALELAGEIADQAPLAVQAIRAASRHAMERTIAEEAEDFVQRARGLMTTEDAMEGAMSFIERRKARFEGK